MEEKIFKIFEELKQDGLSINKIEDMLVETVYDVANQFYNEEING